jgi:hypothetical protein
MMLIYIPQISRKLVKISMLLALLSLKEYSLSLNFDDFLLHKCAIFSLPWNRSISVLLTERLRAGFGFLQVQEFFSSPIRPGLSLGGPQDLVPNVYRRLF